MSRHIAFQLKDFFQEDPLREIYSKRRGDSYLINAYIDYKQDLEFLRIGWQRLKQDCKEVGEIDSRIRQIPPPNENYDNEATSLWLKQVGLMNILQHDIRSFIVTARIIMDKIAKIVMKLLGLSQGIGQKVSFTLHKKNLRIQHPNVSPVYLDFLENRTHWYEQELLLLRDKIIAHANTLIPYWRLSNESGITMFKKLEFGPLKGEHKTVFLEIKNRYVERYANLRVTDNDYETRDDFLRQTRRLDTKLDNDDVVKLHNIVSSVGIAIDEEFLESIAHHLEEFMKEVASIFKDII